MDRTGITGEDERLTCAVEKEHYANMFGPTVGDKIRLGDTDLYAQVESDFTVYGDECLFGGGKVLREGMGQASGYFAKDTLDTVITNALVIDYTGIYKADIGIKDGLIVGIGKAGNPEVMDGVSDGMVFGVSSAFLNVLPTLQKCVYSAVLQRKQHWWHCFVRKIFYKMSMHHHSKGAINCSLLQSARWTLSQYQERAWSSQLEVWIHIFISYVLNSPMQL